MFKANNFTLKHLSFWSDPNQNQFWELDVSEKYQGGKKEYLICSDGLKFRPIWKKIIFNVLQNWNWFQLCPKYLDCTSTCLVGPKTASKIADVSLWWLHAPNQLVRVLKRQNWALSAPTVEKIGEGRVAKNAKYFVASISHICLDHRRRSCWRIEILISYWFVCNSVCW